MKSFNRLFAKIIILLTVIIIGINVYLSSMFHNESGRGYRVEINRLQKEIEINGIESIDIDKFSCITKITMMKRDMDQKLFFEGDLSDYVIKNINGVYYRFDYQIQLYNEHRNIRLVVNISTVVMAFVVLILLVYMRAKLIKPFQRIKEVPFELSKGNLTAGLKENKSHFFGRFVWGLDLLREHLEEEKGKELTLQKEKKTLVLSISHDIKTPLSAIKLYSKALIRNLYDSEEKRIEIAEKIGKSADEIEDFVSQIIKASSEDFLKLEVNNSEFYLKELMQKINSYYSEKLSFMNIDYKIEKYGNCLIKGDINRAIEVLQNIIENAIKYGDGRYIRIMISREEDCRLITVANSGCSLSENELPFIFESFWRGSNVKGNSGNGLGLYICRQLMMKMDGDIYAENVNSEMRITAVMRMI